MITKLLNEVNEKIETLNNLIQDKEYFEKLDERIEKVNNYAQEQKQEIERLNNIIKEVREYIEMHTPSDIGICGNKTKRYYTLGEDSVDHILEILGSDK